MHQPHANPSATAGLWRRLAALLYDSLLLLGVLAVATALLMFICSLVAPSLTDGQILARQWWFRPYLLAWIGAFYLWFWRHGGQTLGMKTWKLRLVAEHGPVPRWTQLGIRALTGFFGLANFSLLLGLPAWHDYLSQTRVLVELAPTKKAG